MNNNDDSVASTSAGSSQESFGSSLTTSMYEPLLLGDDDEEDDKSIAVVHYLYDDANDDAPAPPNLIKCLVRTRCSFSYRRVKLEEGSQNIDVLSRDDNADVIIIDRANDDVKMIVKKNKCGFTLEN